MECLIGDASNAKKKLGWQPKISFKELVAEMVKHDVELALRDELCQSQGFKTFKYSE